MFGLEEHDVSTIKNILKEYPEVLEAYIFGSRAKGNFKLGSDVDIAVKGNNISFRTISSINSKLNEETPLPYHFDILNYNSLTNLELLNHIDRMGKKFYDSSTK